MANGLTIDALWAAKYKALLTSPAHGAGTDMTVELQRYLTDTIVATAPKATGRDVNSEIVEDLN